MNKKPLKTRQNWQSFLIIAVVALTIYNILPTIFFYSKPLGAPVNDKMAQTIAQSAMDRANDLEQEAISWVKSYDKLLGTSAQEIQLVKNNPQFIEVRFATKEGCNLFRRQLPRAGALIPFYPAQLSLSEYSPIHSQALNGMGATDDETTLYLQRKIPLHFSSQDYDQYFSYSALYDEAGHPTAAYREIIEDRLLQIALAIGGPSENAALVTLALENATDPTSSSRAQDFLFILAQNILTYEKTFGENSSLAKQFYSTFTLGNFQDRKATISALIQQMTAYKDRIQAEKIQIKTESDKALAEGREIALPQEILNALQAKEDKLLKAISILKRQEKSFILGALPWSSSMLVGELKAQDHNTTPTLQILSVKDKNPLIENITVDYSNQTITLTLKEELLRLRSQLETASDSATKTSQLGALNQLIFNEIAKITRESSENFVPAGANFTVNISDLPHSSSFLKLDLAQIAEPEMRHVQQLLRDFWNPQHQDLAANNYPLIEWEEYRKQPASEQHLELVLYAPSLTSGSPAAGFKMNSIYIIAKDLKKILRNIESNPSTANTATFQHDAEKLSRLLQANGFIGYPGSTYPLSAEFKDDYIFEASDFYLPLLAATREQFAVHGTKRFAVLELSTVKSRILTLNRIETEIHESLLKWRDEYNAAGANPSLQAKWDIPKPTQNVLWSNFILSAKKYFRGDDRKILHWGLDLSGGKTVQIGLKDANGKTVTAESDIKQAINELYNRVNKMGVSDVSLRQEGSTITLDFPGSQDISAEELVKASSMTFNIINEKFAPQHSALSQDVDRFLTEVWNEAVVTGKKDIDSVNAIAWSHLYGDSFNGDQAEPRSEAARTLYENGLRLPDPLNPDVSARFDDTVSKIALYRGDNFSDWYGQTHPLLVIFKNYALEGSTLENVHAGYDMTKGNFLSFSVTSSKTTLSGQKLSPRKDLHAWTSLFSKDQMMGSSYASYAGGKGWRMAVILNGYVVSAPHLESAISDSGIITGHFTQREINHLVADLKAGSLSFSPQILSEMSISPELGIKERYQGIIATAVALLAIIVTMVTYYRFAGVVASIAVLFNLLIIWATLQNIQATITLANIAGIILTVGMAVDANVLVFERIREEFALTGKLATAIQAGYRKAFSAIIDSNITTIIAALILLNFDSGPIKGFAVSLIIGIVSSMFTALFMTRYFFTKWVQNPNHKELKMLNLIKPKNFNFLKYGKFGLIFSCGLILVGILAYPPTRNSILGMDFTGGYSLTLEVEAPASEKNHESINYRELVKNALIAGGASAQEIQIRELASDNRLRLFLSTNMNSVGHPFHGMAIANSIEGARYSYESNPRLSWIVNSLDASGVKLTERSLQTLDQNWQSISGQMSSTMRNNAIFGLMIALLSILLYITLRFEFTYAMSATLGLAFDILITLAILMILHLAGVPLQIDLNTVAALMTIVGYSLNDTIIVFDRIREDLKGMKRSSFKEIVNHSINVTLSRTLLTSGTTLLVLVTLVLLGGSTIFGFSLVMAIGVFIGTLSTLFISAPLLLYFQQREQHDDSKDDSHHLALNGQN